MPSTYRFTARCASQPPRRPSTSLCVFRPASRRPHRRQSPSPSPSTTHPPCCNLPPPPAESTTPDRTVCTRPSRACADTSARSRHDAITIVGGPGPGPGPGPQQLRPLLTMSRPADGLPSQAGLGDNIASHTPANPLLSRDTTAPHPAPRSQDQDHFGPHRSRPSQKRSSSNSDSQATNLSSDESNRVFSPPMIETAASDGGPGSGQGSSQESQLFQLSQLAAAQDKLPGQAQPSRSAVKRTADGLVKDPRFSPTASPGRTASHSRNTSAVSATSTASSRVTEVSSAYKFPSRCSQHRWRTRKRILTRHARSCPPSSRHASPTPCSKSTMAGNRGISTRSRIWHQEAAPPRPATLQSPARRDHQPARAFRLHMPQRL